MEEEWKWVWWGTLRLGVGVISDVSLWFVCVRVGFLVVWCQHLQ